MISLKSKGHSWQSEAAFYSSGLLPVVPSVLLSLQARTLSVFAKVNTPTAPNSVSLAKADLSLDHTISRTFLSCAPQRFQADLDNEWTHIFLPQNYFSSWNQIV